MLYRKHFPTLESVCYLNSCSMGLLANSVRESLESYISDRDQYGSNWELWVGKLENFRQQIADFIRVSSGEVAVVPSVSNAVNSIASALDFSKGRNKIVCTAYDFPTTAQIWQSHCQRGAKVVYAMPENTASNIALQQFEQLIDEETLLVSIPHVCYFNGSVLPVKEIVQLAHERGAMVMLDCFQSVGNTNMQAQSFGADIMLGGMQKYMLGSSGIAFMYVKNELIKQLSPADTGWFAQQDIAAMDAFHHRPSESARRFEAGTPCVPNLYAAVAAVELLNQIGMESIHQQIDQLSDDIVRRAKQQGFVLNTDVSSHRAMIVFHSKHSEKMVELLAGEGVVTSSRANGVRVSPHFYNNSDDIDALFDALNRYKDYLTLSS